MIFNRFFHFGRHRLQIGLHRRFGIEVEYRPEHLFDLLNCEIGNAVIKHKVDVRPARIINGIALLAAWAATHAIHSDLDVLVPFCLSDRAAVDLKVQAVVPDNELSDQCQVSRFY